jgi:hypothetical protein
MTRWAWASIVMLALSSVAHAQQSQVSVSTATQVITADAYRLAGQHRLEPDLGVSWLRPATVGGTLGLDLNLTRRQDGLRLGRGVATLNDAKAGGFTWDVSAGDSGTPPFVPDFGFSNLHAPTLTFAGAAVSATNSRVTIRTAGGHTTQTRNIFGTDLLDLKQTLVQADLTVKLSDRVQLSTRGSRVRNGDLGTYPTYVDWAQDLGGGLTLKPTDRWQVSADAGVSRFQRRGTTTEAVAPSWLIGTAYTGARGRVELNAQRFSVGRFAAMNYPYNDRQGVFASGEWQLTTPLRLFGGADLARTNLDPAATASAAVAMPEGTQTRAFGGVRLQLGRQFVTLRAEGGGREITPSKFSPGFESDTGALTAEWNATLPGTTVFTRYERRTNVDAMYASSSFRQHEVSSQVFFHRPRNRELFVQAFLLRRADREGGGETDWYAGGGYQTPLKALAVRLEGQVGCTDDWETTRRTPRQMLVANVSGPIARRTVLSADVVITHAPLALADSRPFYTRAMIRLTRTLSYGTPLLPAADGRLAMAGPSGAIDAQVFIDWNANGARDVGDEPAPGVGILIARLGTVLAGSTGHAGFAKVPVGERFVSLDLATVPADYDVPDQAARAVDVAPRQRATVSFGLIPTGTLTGQLYTDTDEDGRLSAGDAPVPNAVVTLDDGSRSELVHDGRFRFDNVRLGPHTVVLDMDSLDPDALLTGNAATPVELTRDGRTASVTYLVRREKRPEVRKVFPPKKVAPPHEHPPAAQPPTPALAVSQHQTTAAMRQETGAPAQPMTHRRLHQRRHHRGQPRQVLAATAKWRRVLPTYLGAFTPDLTKQRRPWTSGFGLQASGFRLQAAGLGLQVPGTETAAPGR